jgi:hypothetical protein
MCHGGLFRARYCLSSSEDTFWSVSGRRLPRSAGSGVDAVGHFDIPNQRWSNSARATPRMLDSFLPARSERKLQVTSGAKSQTTRNETAAEAVFFSINARVRGVD